MIFLEFVENIGDNVIRYSFRTYDFIVFIFRCFFQIFSFDSYNKTAREFFIKQVYLSSIKYFSYFVFLSLFLGSLLIVLAIYFAINFNLIEQIGELLVLFVFNEFSPFFTAIFFTFTYSISSCEYVQNIKKEKENIFNEVYLPQLLNAIFIIPLLALLFATIMISSGYLVSTFYLNIDLMTYKNMIISSISLNNVLILLLKSAVFAFLAVLIPIYFGHIKEKDNVDITQFIVKILIIILSMLLLAEFLFILIFY